MTAASPPDIREAIARVGSWLSDLEPRDTVIFGTTLVSDLRALHDAVKAQQWRPIETDRPPAGAEYITVRSARTYRFLPYKKGSDQRRRGFAGRWQACNGFGGFVNEDLPQIGDWQPLPAPPSEAP